MNKNHKIYNYITKIAVFSALSYVLYLVKFPLPIFPSFLEIQFSNVPLLLGGFVLGPVGGVLIALIRGLFKLLSTHTAGVGELADFIIGIAVVVPSSLFYKHHKTKKGGILSLVIASLCWIAAGLLSNWLISMPFYVKAFGLDAVLGMLKAILPQINETNYMKYYLFGSVLPFNLMLSIIICLITFFVYKPLSKLFHKDFFGKIHSKKENQSSIKEEDNIQ